MSDKPDEKLEIGDKPADPAAEPAPGSEEYNAKMAAAGRAGRVEAPDPTKTDLPPMPENGHEKFYDKATGAYNWEAHARELEFKAAQKGDKDDKPAEGGDKDDKPAEGDKASDVEVDAFLEGLELDPAAIRESIAKDGKVPDDAIEKLTAAGIPRALIDEYAQLGRYKVESEANSAVAYAGGQEETDALIAWAGANLDEKQKAHYNDLLDGPDWKIAIDGLKALKAASNPLSREGRREQGDAGGAGAGDKPFLDDQDKVRAINAPDPHNPAKRRYDTDPVYRAEIARRIQATSLAAAQQRG